MPVLRTNKGRSHIRILLIFFLSIFGLAKAQKFDNVALTPPMGWNSWNSFACNVTEKTIRDAADALVSSGMQKAGYEYVVIDDCWQIGRDSLGFITADAKKFPSGIKALADYIHSRGLKFGIYSCAGRMTCQNRPGSRGHEFQDALTYAKWGVDFLKLDWCNSDGQDAKESYSLMRDALYAAGRPIVLSLCEWGLSKPWEWAGNVGHLWRTTGDIRNNWNIPDAKQGKCWGGGVEIILDMQEGLETYAGPGHWNDPDMLEVGNHELTEGENRAHFSLWCMLAAPLMAGNDLNHMDEAIAAILTNKEVIAIDQDALGRQGFKIKDYGEFEVYYKPLQNGDIALCFFNRYNDTIKVDWDFRTMSGAFWKQNKRLTLHPTIDRSEIKPDAGYDLYDLWKKKIIGNTMSHFIAEIPAHNVEMLRLTRR
jgi:alpha-galactosidase